MASSDLIIEELGPQGDGVHVGEKGRVFIDRALPGDRIEARISREPGGLARGEIVKILEPSPYRQDAPCKHYDYCGNCTMQHARPDFYRQWKTQIVADAFKKNGVRPRRWLEPVFIPGGSRRRITFSAFKSRGEVTVGYYRRRSQQIGEVDSCLVADPQLLELRPLIKDFLSKTLTESESVDVFLQRIGEGTDLLFTGSLGRHGKPDAFARTAALELMEKAPIFRISWRPNEKSAVEQLHSRAPLLAEFGALKVSIPAGGFLQPSLAGEQALVKAVMSALPEKGKSGKRFSGKYADLFSGSGTFTGPLLQRGSVDAFESVPNAVQALTKAGREHRLRVTRRDLFANPLRESEISRYEVVVFDPPRAGCPEQAEEMAFAKARTLIGVSCNPSTFARDARLICEGGYKLATLQVFDQFPWSHHVEMVGVFQR